MMRRAGIGRLAIRHALLAAVLGVTIGAGFSVLQVGDDYRASVAAERREILQMLAVMREPAAQACYNLNVHAAKVVVQGALSYVPVQSARLVSDFGETLAQGEHAPAAAPAAAADEAAWWTRFVAPTQSYSLPLAVGPDRKAVGTLTVVTAQAPRVERFLQGAWRDMGVNVWRGVTVALALGVLSFITLTRPLTAIARRIGHSAPGQADETPLAEARRRDEIGEIASAFERYEREAGERTRSLQASARALAASDAELRATNARLTSMVVDLERHKSDMALIAELNGLLQSARTEDEAFDVIRTAAARLFADAGGGFAVVGQDDAMVVVGAWGATGGLQASFQRCDCWAIRRGGPHLQSPQHGVRCGHQAQDQQGATLCTPLYVEGELLGVLHLHGASDAAAFGESVQQRVEVFGEVVKLGLSNLRLRDTLREQALRDVLTGLPNRRLFDETLPRELARCLRSGQPLTVAVIDVDHFKRFNDSYGHDAGDQVLRAVAQVLGRAIRASDMACRYGGDEFMCLLPGMAAPDAAARFERALHQLAEDAGDAPLPGETVTLTVGLATAPGCGTDAAALMRAADAALYVAKEKGRNRVEVAGPVGVELEKLAG